MPPEGWKPRVYETLDELRAELDRVEAAHQRGTLTTTGQWSAGQILEHCATLIRCSIDGFGDARVPWFVRLAGRVVFKPRLGRTRMKPGIKLPRKASSLLPGETVGVDEGLSAMRAVLARIEAGERMTADSPVLGPMTHEQWLTLHLDHCRLHLGFLDLGVS